jgi:predicted nucleotidyltransferase
MFTVGERERVRRRLVEIAESDPRIVAAALVGSLATSDADEWSDIDVALGVDESFAIAEVLGDWSRTMSDEFNAVALLDLTARGATYRVFLLDDWLQADLSFAPASGFRQGSPNFKLLFGAHTTAYVPLPSPHDIFGWGVVYARAARASIDREKWWQAEFSVSAVRDRALTLACVHRGIPTGHGKGFDDLPASVVAGLDGALVGSLEREELLRALDCAVGGLLRESHDVRDLAETVAPQLRELPGIQP